MAGTVYAMSVVMTNGYSGYVKFYGDGTWDWHLVKDVDEATLYRSKQECLDDFYKYVEGGCLKNDSGVTLDRRKCTIAECYCPWI